MNNSSCLIFMKNGKNDSSNVVNPDNDIALLTSTKVQSKPRRKVNKSIKFWDVKVLDCLSYAV